MPQLGAAIGGLIGGWISPTQVNGPHIGDGAAQTSQEGIPIAWVIGTAGWIQPNIVDKSPRREVKKTDDGKGSGTEVNTFEAHQDFVLMVCESSETRESLMTGVLMVRVDGKIVYDMRPDKNFGAENVKFLKNHTFYNGNEAQLPDPTAESFPHNGVGNTPAYRGVYTVVARDINLTQYGERIPTYEFVMVGQGESNSTDITYLVPPVYARFANAHWPLVDASDRYTYTGRRVIVTAGSDHTYSADSIEEILEYFGALGFNGVPQDLSFYQGYSATTSTVTGTFGIDSATAQLDVTQNISLLLTYNVGEADDWFDAAPASACPLLPYVSPGQPQWYGFKGGELARIAKGPSSDPQFVGYNNCTAEFPPESGYYPFLQGSYPLRIQVFPKNAPQPAPDGDPCLLGVPTRVPDAPGYVQDCAGVVSAEPIYTPTTGTFATLQIETTMSSGGRNVFVTRQVGPVIVKASPGNTQAFWENAYGLAVIAGTVAPGKVWPSDYPKDVLTAYLATVENPEVISDAVGLDTVISRIAVRGGLEASDIDVSEMDQDVLGYPILQSYNGADCIRPLMTAYTSYGSEYDAKLRFHKHGEDADFSANPDDFIQSGETSKGVREQDVEFPRLIGMTSIDPTQDYTARPQYARRISTDVRAIGEQSLQVPVVLNPDPTRQLAEIAMKVAWARAEGTEEFSVPYATDSAAYLNLVAGKAFGLYSKRYIAGEYALEDGEIKIKAFYDRQSAYTSNVSATPALPPTPPPSSIGGVTLFAALNVGVLRDQDDTLGLYFAVGGILDAWPGALIQWKLDTDTDWQTAVASATQASTMGYLTQPLPLAPASGDDVTNTLSVSVHGGELNSITRFQYLNEMNPFAIISDETTGECEIGQFQTATEIDPGNYDLTILTRGALNSEPAAHPQGTRFVYLDAVYFVPVPAAWRGRVINIRPVTFGTIPDNNASYSILWDPQVSQVEWEAYGLDYNYVGSAIVAYVTPRHRLGNDVAPVASSNFTGYRWTATDGTFTQTFDTGLNVSNQPFVLSLFTGPITITVSPLNRFTGPGPSVSITTP